MLKVATYAYEGCLDKCALYDLTPRQGCWHPGYCGEIFVQIFNFIQLPYQLISYEGPIYGEFENNSWTRGPLKELQDGNVDLLVELHMNSKRMRKKFEVSYTIQQLRWVLLINGPETELTASSAFLTDVFTKNAWLTFALTAISLCIWFAVYICWKIAKDSRQTDVYECITKSPYRGLKAMWAIFGIFMIFFCELYQSSMLSFLIHEPIKDQWDSIRMIKNGRIKLLAFSDKRGSAFFNYRESSLPFFEKLREALTKNPVVFENRPQQFFELFKTGKYMMILTEDNVHYFKKWYCHTQVIKTEGLPVYGFSIIVRKGSALKSKIDGAILTHYEKLQAIIERHRNRMMHTQCSEKIHRERARNPIKLRALSPAFVFLGVFLASTVIVFTAEYVLGCYVTSESANNRSGQNQTKVSRCHAVFESKESQTLQETPQPDQLLHHINDFVAQLQGNDGLSLTENQFSTLQLPQLSKYIEFRFADDVEINEQKKSKQGKSYEIVIKGIKVIPNRSLATQGAPPHRTET